jgi:hypothetical protein
MFVIFVGFIDLDDRGMIELLQDGHLVDQGLVVFYLFLIYDLNCTNFVRKEVRSGLVHSSKGAFAEDLNQMFSYLFELIMLLDVVFPGLYEVVLLDNELYDSFFLL